VKEVSVGNARLLDGGTPISFNNLMDANAAFELCKEFDEPAAVVVKHMNPCGCAVDEDICKAYEKAYLGDVVSAFGGIVAVNRTIDKELATVIMESYARFGKARGGGLLCRSDYRSHVRRRRRRGAADAEGLGRAGSPAGDRPDR
jgi:phosphoribosylaminoimidazolecarboxamide formyltransferase / IMP cyclohydrolase